MVDDRNLSSHTYHETLAEEINNRIDKNYELLLNLTQRLEEKMKNSSK
jgi:hypothetical protein